MSCTTKVGRSWPAATVEAVDALRLLSGRSGNPRTSVVDYLCSKIPKLLVSYGPARIDYISGAANYVDRILKGAKVSGLPFEEPTDIKLVINLRTARSLGIVIPQNVLIRADEVIE
jgi:hypothetical protein